MASKPFPFDERPNEVCCYPDYPCCTETTQRGANEEANARAPSMAHGQKEVKHELN